MPFLNASCAEEKVNRWLTGIKEKKRESTLIFLMIDLELQPFSNSEGLTGAGPTAIYFSAKRYLIVNLLLVFGYQMFGKLGT